MQILKEKLNRSSKVNNAFKQKANTARTFKRNSNPTRKYRVCGMCAHFMEYTLTKRHFLTYHRKFALFRMFTMTRVDKESCVFGLLGINQPTNVRYMRANKLWDQRALDIGPEDCANIRHLLDPITATCIFESETEIKIIPE